MATRKLDIQIGLLYWCDTARSDIRARFSDKARRPVLVIEVIEDYAAVYPCSRYRDDLGASEWVGSLLGEANTHIFFGSGLYYVPVADLEPPGTAWDQWETAESVYRKIIAADLDTFRFRHQERLYAPAPHVRNAESERLTTPLGNLFSEEVLRRLMTPEPSPAPPAPAAAPKPRPVPRKLTPQEEFQRALDTLQPYHILKQDGEEPAPSPFNARGKKKRK